MTDDEIIQQLKEAAMTETPVRVALLLRDHAEGGLTHGALVSYFKRAFPAVPLRTLLDAGAWKGVSIGGTMSDDDFNALLGSLRR